MQIFAQPVAGRVGLSNEKVNGYRAIVAADAEGAAMVGNTPGTPLYGKQLAAVIRPPGAAPTSARGDQPPAAPPVTQAHASGSGTSGNPPPGSPTTTSATSPSMDVLGVRLGMPLAEAIERLKAYDAAIQIGPVQHRFAPLPNPMTVGARGAIRATATTGGRYNRENIVLEAVPGPEPAVVTAIYRFAQHSEEPLALTNTVAAITEKYGKPAFQVAMPSALGFTWYYDANGSAVYPPERLSCFERSDQKIGVQSDLMQNIMNPTLSDRAAADCGAFLSVFVARDGDVVMGLTTYAADERLRASRFNAMKAMRAEAAAQANSERAREAASRGDPQL